MRARTVVGGALTTVLLAAALAGVLMPWSLGGSSASTISSSKTTTTFLLACGPSAVAQPTSFPLECGDVNSVLDDLHWKDWGDDTATATGIARINSCDPDCSSGEVAEYPVDVTVTERVASGPISAYGTLELAFTEQAPEWAVKGVARYDLVAREAHTGSDGGE